MTERIPFSELAHFNPKQLMACQVSDQRQYTLYGGSRGPGKSYWLRWQALRLALRYAGQGLENVRGAICCENYPTLRDRQISRITAEFPLWLGEVRESQEHGLGFHIRPEYGGGVIAMRNLDDPHKYRSAEFAFVCVDELTRNPIEVFHALRGSLRWPGIPAPRFCAATNPGGVGHLWVRALWIDGDFPKEMESLRGEFGFVRALPEDNKYLDESYWRMLETLPEDLARAWRYGDWDVFEGQFFTSLKRDVHGFSGQPPKGNVICAFDYGERAPSAVYWAVVDHAGEVWVYRELYRAGLQYLELKRLMLQMTPRDELERLLYTVASPDIFATSRGTGVVGAEVFNRSDQECGGFAWPVVAADPNRVEGWRHMKAWLAAKRVHFHLENLPQWWRTAPAMAYDPVNTEDMDDRGEDHACEAIRYLLMSRPPATAPEVDRAQPDRRVDSYIFDTREDVYADPYDLSEN